MFSTVFDHPHEYYYVHVGQCKWILVLINFQERFQMIIFDAFSVKMLSIFVWTEGLNAEVWMRAFQPYTYMLQLIFLF